VNSRYISQIFICGAKDRKKLKISTKRDVIVKPHSASPWMLEFQSHSDRISKICQKQHNLQQFNHEFFRYQRLCCDINKKIRLGIQG
jgi:predicted transcriptional regulator